MAWPPGLNAVRAAKKLETYGSGAMIPWTPPPAPVEEQAVECTPMVAAAEVEECWDCDTDGNTATLQLCTQCNEHHCDACRTKVTCKRCRTSMCGRCGTHHFRKCSSPPAPGTVTQAMLDSNKEDGKQQLRGTNDTGVGGSTTTAGREGPRPALALTQCRSMRK